jgi:hypothetical protein
VIGADDQAGTGDGAPTGAAAHSSGGESAMVALTDERRSKLLAFVENNTRMPKEVRARMAEQLKAKDVPADLVAQLEGRMGG